MKSTQKVTYLLAIAVFCLTNTGFSQELEQKEASLKSYTDTQKLFESGDYDQYLAASDQLLSKQGSLSAAESEALRANMAAALLHKQDFDKARETALEAAKLATSNEHAKFQAKYIAAHVLFDKNDDEAFITEAKQLIDAYSDINDKVNFNELKDANQNQGITITSDISADPNIKGHVTELRKLVGLANYRLQRWQDSRNELEKVLKINPDDAVVKENWVKTLYYCGDYGTFFNEAESYIKKFTDQEPLIVDIEFSKSDIQRNSLKEASVNENVDTLILLYSNALLAEEKWKSALLWFNTYIQFGDTSEINHLSSSLAYLHAANKYAQYIFMSEESSLSDHKVIVLDEKGWMAPRPTAEELSLAKTIMANSSSMFDEWRAMANDAIKTEKITGQDVTSVKMLILESYEFEANWPMLETEAMLYSSQFPEGSLEWARGFHRQGIAQFYMGNMDKAAVSFETVMNANFEDTAMYDHLKTRSAHSRANIAWAQNDKNKVREIYNLVSEIYPNYPAKQQFLDALKNYISE